MKLSNSGPVQTCSGRIPAALTRTPRGRTTMSLPVANAPHTDVAFEYGRKTFALSPGQCFAMNSRSSANPPHRRCPYRLDLAACP